MPSVPPVEPKFVELQRRLKEVSDIKSVISLLHWDQATQMPVGGATARGCQIATLKRIAHERFTDSAVGELLEDLRTYETSLPYDSLEASLIRVTRRDYQQAVYVPAEYMARLAQHQAVTYETWAKARQNHDFALVQPNLEKTLELSQEYASFFPGYEHIADPLINQGDFGITVSMLRSLWSQLREQLLPIVEIIRNQPPIDDACLHQYFPENEQLQFGTNVLSRIGFDWRRGRQDKSPHPFTAPLALGDVRITTRVDKHHFAEALFSSLHEMGHALYEQGLAPELEGTPLAEGASFALHESQARLWENLVGRSRAFWEWFYPRLQGIFMRQLGQVSTQQFYRAINKVSPSLIRTDADEVTYNLHIIIRFDLELALLEGNLAVRDLPEAWNERYKTDLGVVPAHHAEGVLQDVHWYSDVIGGMFQGYALGNLISAQLYETAVELDPEIPFDIERGNFQRLHYWLRENIYQPGRKYTTHELIEQVTGSPLSIDPFIRYIRHKYEYIYQCKLS